MRLPTTANFFTLVTPATATFAFEGHSAVDSDTMYLSLDLGTPVFVNQTSSAGATCKTELRAAGVHQLSLVDTSVADTWSPDPAKNIDGQVHLVADAIYLDFKLGAPRVVAPIYYGGKTGHFRYLILTTTIWSSPCRRGRYRSRLRSRSSELACAALACWAGVDAPSRI